MSINLFAYLDTAPTLDQIRETLLAQGVLYRHTLPADERWAYPMHVFGGAELRFVYHAGDPEVGDALVDGRASVDAREAEVRVRVVLVALVRRYGGAICDPRELQRGAVL